MERGIFIWENPDDGPGWFAATMTNGLSLSTSSTFNFSVR